MLVVAIVGAGLFALAAEPLVNAVAREEVLQSSRIMMESAAGARKYTSEQIAPILKPQIGQHFYPQSVSAYAAKRNFDVIHEKFPDYMYREAALNPTNPQDRATDWEADIIDDFRAHPEQEGSLARTGNGNRPDARARAAPGQQAGVHGMPQHRGHGASIDDRALRQRERLRLETGRDHRSTNRISADVRLCRPRGAYPQLFVLPFIGFLALLFISMNVLLHFVVIRPMEKIADSAEAVSMGKIDTPEYQYDRPRPDRPPRLVLQPDAPEPGRGLQDAWRVSDEAALSDSYFLSYSRADESLRCALPRTCGRRRGHVGRPARHPAERALGPRDRACRPRLLRPDRHPLASLDRSDNVADEISYAIDSGKPVLPVMIERCTAAAADHPDAERSTRRRLRGRCSNASPQSEPGDAPQSLPPRSRSRRKRSIPRSSAKQRTSSPRFWDQ